MIFFLLALMVNPALEPAGSTVMTRESQVRRYFSPRPPPGIKYQAAIRGWLGSALVITGGVLLALGHTMSGTGTLIIGLATVGAGLTLAGTYQQEYRKSWPKPSEATMDAYLEADRATAATRAMKRMDLTPEQVLMAMAATLTRDPLVKPPIMLWPPEEYLLPLTAHGPVLDDKAGPPCRHDMGPMRFRAHHMLVLCPTRHHIGVYRCRIDMRTGSPREEQLYEIYYSDVSMISLSHESEHVTVEARTEKGYALGTFGDKLSLRELQIAFRGGEYDKSDKPGKKSIAALVPNAQFDTVVRALRGLLRERKQPHSVL